jgi:hypothetical protein
MSEDVLKIVRLDRAPRNREGYVDPTAVFADELVHPPAPAPGVPIAKRPQAARDRNPRLSGPVAQNKLDVAAGKVMHYEWTHADGTVERGGREGPCTIREPLDVTEATYRSRRVSP